MTFRFGDKIKIVGLPFYEGSIGYVIGHTNLSSAEYDVLIEFNIVRSFYADNLTLFKVKKSVKKKRGAK